MRPIGTASGSGKVENILHLIALKKPKSKQSKIKYTAKTYFAATATAMATSKATATATAKRQSNRKPISQHVLVASPTSSLLKCLSALSHSLCLCPCDSVSSFHFLLHLAKAALSCAKDDGDSDSDSGASFQSSIAVVAVIIIAAAAVVCGAAQNCREIPLA